MCFSAQVKEHWRQYMREMGAKIDLHEFAKLYSYKSMGLPATTPKAMDAAFLRAESETADERQIRDIIVAHDQARIQTWETELFVQKKRIADAERALALKPTKKAANDQRIATDKIEQRLRWIADANRTESKPRDSRIYPMWYAPVMTWEDGRRVVKPMRYHCRPAGKPAFYDTKYPGCYNARRDNLEGFWRRQFGDTHGVMLATAFYENVSRHALEGRELQPDEKEENVVIEFKPRPEHVMLVACIWSRWTGPEGEELLSFAAVTDEPPEEVAAAGHDRCIIPIKEENLDAWLQPSGDLAKCYSILDDRERPYYEHRMAA